MKTPWYRRRFIHIVLIVLAVLFVVWRAMFFIKFAPATGRQEFGVSFSPSQTDYLDVDGREVFRALLDDLGVRKLRLAAYWNRIEKDPGTYMFDELDYYMDQSAKRNAQVILVIGRRLPRWPECHDPEWTRQLSEQDKQEKIVELVTATVERYRGHPALRIWQVENEPFLTIFGECPQISRDFFAKEINLVRQLDPGHPIMTTDSGELASWLRTAHLGDFFGTTMYRVVWQPVLGYVKHELTVPASFYRLKAWLVRVPPEKIFVSELQAEPWAPDGLAVTPIPDQLVSMDFPFFKRNIEYAESTGFPEIYLWGAEWWFWLKQQGHAEHWDYANTLF